MLWGVGEFDSLWVVDIWVLDFCVLGYDYELIYLVLLSVFCALGVSFNDVLMFGLLVVGGA